MFRSPKSILLSRHLTTLQNINQGVLESWPTKGGDTIPQIRCFPLAFEDAVPGHAQKGMFHATLLFAAVIFAIVTAW